jgi:hypothetical protein
MAGISCAESRMHLSTRQHWLGMDFAGTIHNSYYVLVLSHQVKHFYVFAMLKNVDYLLIAKPYIASNHLGIRRDCAVPFVILPVAGSSLWRPWSLFINSVTERWVSEICEIGKQGNPYLLASDELVSTKYWTQSQAAVGFILTKLMNSWPRKWNSHDYRALQALRGCKDGK